MLDLKTQWNVFGVQIDCEGDELEVLRGLKGNHRNLIRQVYIYIYVCL